MHHSPAPISAPVGPIALTPWQYWFAGYVCGLFHAAYPWPAALCALALLGTTTRRQNLLGLCVAFALGSMILSQPSPTPEEHGARHSTLRGRVIDVRTYPGQRLNLLADDLHDVTTGEPVDGRLLWTWTAPSTVPARGDWFEAPLRIRPLHGRANFGMSSSQDYWHRLGVRWQSYAQTDTVVRWERRHPNARQHLMAAVQAQLRPDVAGATLTALLFGDKSALSAHFMDQIRRAGLSHSLALSGLHLSLVAGLGYVLAWGLALLCPPILLLLPRQKLGTLLAIPLAATYLWMGDAPASLQRAAIMLGVLAVYQLRGRVRYLQDALFLAAAILILPNPQSIHDMGLQFSVLAVAGILIFAPLCGTLVARFGRGSWLLRPLRGILLIGVVSLAANSLLVPVLCAYFGETSPHLYLNVLWLPILSFGVLPLGFIGVGCLGLGLPDAVARFCFDTAGLGVEMLAWVLNYLDARGLLDTTVVLRPTGTSTVAYWLVLIATAWLASRPHSRRAMRALCAGLLLLLCAIVPPLPFGTSTAVTLTVLDTGMSQAVLIRCASGRSLLVDGGGSWSLDYDIGRAIVGPALTYAHPPKLDGVILSHVDADHVRGLHHILRTFDVGWFGWSGLVDGTDESTRLLDVLSATRPTMRTLRAGKRLELDHNLYVDVLYPPPEMGGISENNTSLILRLVYKGHGLALLPGDAERPALSRLVNATATLDADVLIAPHHGSVSSLETSFLQRVAPRHAVAACSKDNRFGFPHARVRDYFAQHQIPLWTTGEHGAVRCEWDQAGILKITTARDTR